MPVLFTDNVSDAGIIQTIWVLTLHATGERLRAINVFESILRVRVMRDINGDGCNTYDLACVPWNAL